MATELASTTLPLMVGDCCCAWAGVMASSVTKVNSDSSKYLMIMVYRGNTVDWRCTKLILDLASKLNECWIHSEDDPVLQVLISF